MHACSSTILYSIQQQQPSIHTHPLSPSAFSQLLKPTSLNPIPLTPLSATTSIDCQSLSYRFSSVTNTYALNPTEIQLFHTLHYLILDDNEKNNSIDNNCFLSLNIIELFIYLFIPYIHTYIRNNEKEFLSNPNLVQGMHLIWEPLFEYRQPNIRMFNAFVKPMISSNISSNDSHSIENNNPRQKRLPILIESTIPRSMSEKQPLSDLTNQLRINIEGSNISLFQPIIKMTKEQKLNQFLHVDPDTITNNSITDLSTSETLNNNTKTRAPLVHMNSICSISDLSRLTISPQITGFDN
jgi:hypothetical protein